MPATKRAAPASEAEASAPPSSDSALKKDQPTTSDAEASATGATDGGKAGRLVKKVKFEEGLNDDSSTDAEDPKKKKKGKASATKAPTKEKSSQKAKSPAKSTAAKGKTTAKGKAAAKTGESIEIAGVILPSKTSSKTAAQQADLDDAEGHDGRSYWLMKAEPESRLEKGVDVKFSIDDLMAKDKPEAWDGKSGYLSLWLSRALTWLSRSS